MIVGLFTFDQAQGAKGKLNTLESGLLLFKSSPRENGHLRKGTALIWAYTWHNI